MKRLQNGPGVLHEIHTLAAMTEYPADLRITAGSEKAPRSCMLDDFGICSSLFTLGFEQHHCFSYYIQSLPRTNVILRMFALHHQVNHSFEMVFEGKRVLVFFQHPFSPVDPSLETWHFSALWALERLEKNRPFHLDGTHPLGPPGTCVNVLIFCLVLVLQCGCS